MAGRRTVFEISGRLVDAETSGDKLIIPAGAPPGAPVYPPFEVRPPPEEAARSAREGQKQRQEGTLSRTLGALLPWLAGPPVAPAPGAALAWHTHQRRLAVADGADRIQIFDLSPTPAHQAGEQRLPQPAATLQHELQAQVTCLDWRPNSRGELAAGCAGGVAHWRLWQQPATACGSGQPRLLRPAEPARIAAVAWSPCGRLLAGGHADRGGFTVWDAALGTPTPVSAGTGPVSLLRWSPDGSYLLTAGPSGAFSLWETGRWRRAAYRAPTGSSLAAAAWSPDSRTALLAFSRAEAQLCALSLTRPPPSLQTQLLPLELPGPGGRGGAGLTVVGMDWDAAGERLAVACSSGGASGAPGDVTLYATTSAPVVKAHRLGAVSGGGGGDAAAAVRFHPRFGEGALLALGSRGGSVCAVPLLFAGGRGR